MASQNFLDDPYIKAALAQKQQQDAAIQQQQQAYYGRLAEIDRGKAAALSQLESYASTLPEAVRAGAGVQWELNAEKKRLQRQAELARLELSPDAKGADTMRGIIKDKYPDAELARYEDTKEYNQAYDRFTQISNKFNVADILNLQLKTFGEDLVQAKEADARGDKETANFYRERARSYGVAQLSQNYANALNPNAQSRDEFTRAAEPLIDAPLVLGQGGSIKQVLGTAWSKFNNPKATEADKAEVRASLAAMIGDSLRADPERWYQTAQQGNKDFQAQKERLYREQIVSKVGPHHAEVMGALKPVVYDPLADYMAKGAQAPKRGFGMVEQPIDRSGSFTLSTGAGSTIPMQSGTMQAGTIQPGTVSGGTMAPTSRPRTKFTVLLPQ
jgi:hypothetical protein